MTTAHVITTVN